MRLRSASLMMLCALSLSALASLAAAACPASTPKVNVQQANGKIEVQVVLEPRLCEETYGPWMPLREGNGMYREYTYRINNELKRHYLIWLSHEPARCYCYNRDTGMYWGRWNKDGQQTTFTKATRKSTTVTETAFEQRTTTPTAPGTEVPMTPPPSFPSDLPPDVR